MGQAIKKTVKGFPVETDFKVGILRCPRLRLCPLGISLSLTKVDKDQDKKAKISKYSKGGGGNFLILSVVGSAAVCNGYY